MCLWFTYLFTSGIGAPQNAMKSYIYTLSWRLSKAEKPLGEEGHDSSSYCFVIT